MNNRLTKADKESKKSEKSCAMKEIGSCRSMWNVKFQFLKAAQDKTL